MAPSDTSYDTLGEPQWAEVERIYDLLEDEQVESARRAIEGLLSQRPGHPDLRMVDAAVSLEEGDAARALQALAGAERSADPSAFFHLRAVAAYELVRFEAARDDAQRALDIQPDFAEVHDLLSRALAHLGDDDASDEHAEQAEVLDPESFPEPLAISDEEFDGLVERCLLELPPRVRTELEQLPVIVEPLPARALLTAEDPPLSPDLLGLFVGHPLLERSGDDPPAAPGAIYLFRHNLLRACHDREELEREVRITVQHEVGHLLGLDEDDLERWGLA